MNATNCSLWCLEIVEKDFSIWKNMSLMVLIKACNKTAPHVHNEPSKDKLCHSFKRIEIKNI